MPIVTVSIKEGRTVEQKREMARRVTEAICETMNARPEVVRIIIHDLKGEDFAIGGTLVCDDPALQYKPNK